MEECAPGTADLDSRLAEFVETSRRDERRTLAEFRIAVAFVTTLAVLATAGSLGSLASSVRPHAHQRDLARYLSAEAEDLRTLHPGLANSSASSPTRSTTMPAAARCSTASEPLA